MGSAAIAGTAFTGTALANHIDIWVWRTNNAGSGAQDNAVDALQNAANQIGYSDEIYVSDQGELDGDWPGHGTYDQYLDEFDQERPFTYDGDVHYLIYRQPLVEDWSFTDDAAAGYATSWLRSSTSPRAMANADMSNYDMTTYTNFVKHEFMHTIIDDDNAPDYGNDHSFGAQVGWLAENTPMLTGYAESNRGGNEKPDSCCNKDNVETSNYHTGSLSSCTKNEAQRWLANEY
jgi:hypothetical protein